MANYTITLSEQTYHRLLSIAQENDTTPEAWLDAQLSPSPETPQPLPQLLTGLIGAMDSKADPTPRSTQSKFGAALACLCSARIAAKLSKQGIQRP